MKTQLFNMCFCIVVFVTVNAQNHNSEHTQVAVSCLMTDEQSHAEKRILTKLRLRDYDAISRFLSSNNSDLQFLALITLEHLEKLKTYELTPSDKKQIELIKKSSQLITICSNSNQSKRIALKTLLSRKFIAELWRIRIFNSE